DLSKFVAKLPEGVTEKSVHRLRTTIRRVQTLVGFTRPELGKKQQKALDELQVLRKRAGKVRDLDIQIGLLGSIGNRSASADRRALLEELKKKRARQAERLIAALKKLETSKFLKRLERVTEKAVTDVPDNGGAPLEAAQKELSELAEEYSSRQVLKPARLHELRIKLKLLRYRAELAAESPEQKEFVERVKSVQDAIGEWHDWEMLAESAEKQFEDRINCALLIEIRSLLAAKFSAATTAALNLLTACVPPGKKKPVSVQMSRAAAQSA
ncbi:MAG TPA: CHAD domain-containing protein, partial [Candidatus Angelobacter sp.]